MTEDEQDRILEKLQVTNEETFLFRGRYLVPMISIGDAYGVPLSEVEAAIANNAERFPVIGQGITGCVDDEAWRELPYVLTGTVAEEMRQLLAFRAAKAGGQLGG